MHNTYEYLPRGARDPIDITPGSGWRRALQVAGVALLVAVAVPLVWLLGLMTLIALLGLAAVMLIAAIVRGGWRGGRWQTRGRTVHWVLRR